MQGFNKYYPPDYDGAKHKSLNAYRGKHALGDRARKLDQGVLITRFELPFNIWCGGCDAHIGMGVRYNAEKRKVGNYYSTPIYAFRFQNTRYVVESGARQKVEDWDPEENGGFAVHENDPSKNTPLDPLQSLEKSTAQIETFNKHSRPHLEQLQELSDARSSDPYTLSVRLRKDFRAAKHVALRTKAADDAIRDKYGLDTNLKLVAQDDPVLRQEAKEGWEEGQRQWEEEQAKRRLHDAQSGPVEFRQGSSSSGSGPSSSASSSSRPPARFASSPKQKHQDSRPVHKSHSQAHKSADRSIPPPKPILKKDQLAKAAKAKTISTLTATLVANSARKVDPFAQGGIGVMGRSSTRLPELARRN
ncbi:Coiled-coil domain-containing protein [Ceratobasidium theobromae]|uniref:Coiled-coil domain-containing protein n=1 Tax=Ceratobasidium theobromae TaxID=1582974 RepID=A0A5N5QT57_9AGAM|nr:Coiled-coil domain-containing protein [Ceratobasidium theobromae]